MASGTPNILYLTEPPMILASSTSVMTWYPCGTVKRGGSLCINSVPTSTCAEVTAVPSGKRREWSVVTSTIPVCVITRTMLFEGSKACRMTHSKRVHPPSDHISVSGHSPHSFPSARVIHSTRSDKSSNVVTETPPFLRM